MGWHWLILANTFLAAVSYLAYRAVARKNATNQQALAVNAGFYVFQYLTILFVVPFLGRVNLQIFWHYLSWFIGGGAGFALANFFLYKLLSHIDAGLSSVLGTLNVLFTVVFAALVLHEDLSKSEAAGGFILLFTIIFVLLVVRKPGRHRGSANAWLWGLVYALLAGIFYGAAAVNEKFLVGHMNLPTYIIFGWGWQVIIAVAMAVLVFPRAKTRSIINNKTAYFTVLGGIARGLAGLFFLLALVKANNVALVTVVSNFRLILIVLLGAIILKEREKLAEKLLASGLALAALALIFWG